ncbi:MAG TPA: hypothetical protein VKZ57_01360 [Sphingobacterium sp.]|jgi:hypothetical protein|nr:hypothetical protein [Sphingobacterium sp.]
MMKKYGLLLLFIVIITILNSCSSVLKKLYGVEDLKEFNPVKYEESIRYMENHFRDVTSIISNDTLFKKYTEGFSSFSRNDIFQPIQILYYQSDTLTSYHINCYAKGALNGRLDWNFDGKFDTYPPKTAVQITKTKKLSDILSIYGISESTDSDTIIFFWSTILNKQAKEAFKMIIDNIQKYHEGTRSPRIITINIDKVYL